MGIPPLSGELLRYRPAPVLQKQEREAQVALFRAKAEEIRALADMMSFQDTREMLLRLAHTYDHAAETLSRIRRPEES